MPGETSRREERGVVSGEQRKKKKRKKKKSHLGWISRKGKLQEKGRGGEEHEERFDERSLFPAMKP